MSDPLIEIKNLQKILVTDDGSRRLLNISSLSIPKGEFVCIIGASGCGKTTLLSILGLVDQEYEGEITYHLPDRKIVLSSDLSLLERGNKAHELRSQFGYIFQDIRLRYESTGTENVTDALIYVGKGDQQNRGEHAKQLLLGMGLSSIDQDRRASTLSGGMQQRVAIARALALNPILICADEPTAHLDSARSDDIYKQLQQRCKEQGITLIVVTHDIQCAKRFADKIIILPNEWSDTAVPLETIPSEELSGDLDFSLADEDLDEEGTESSIEKSTLSQALLDMWFEAVKEVLPIFLFFGYLLNKCTFGLLQRWKLPKEKIPTDLYVPKLLAMLIFGFLASLTFCFYQLKTGIVQYQDSLIRELEVVKRVRVIDPSDTAGNRKQLNIEDLREYFKSVDIAVDVIVPNHSLQGIAVLPVDINYFEHHKKWSDDLNDLLFPNIYAADFLEQTDRFKRLNTNIMGIDPIDPLAKDLGINDLEAFQEEAGIPKIVLNPNSNLWKYHGSFKEMPEIGDTLHMIISSKSKITMKGRRKGKLLKQCLKFTVAGYLNPKESSYQFERKIPKSFMHGVLRRQTFNSIVEWQYDPLDPATLLPSEWRCNDNDISSASYKRKGEKVPIADSYDIFAATPDGTLQLPKYIDEYAGNNDIQFGSIISEKEFVEMVNNYKEISSWVGNAMEIFPLSIASILLWYVIGGILQNRRDQLLLFMVMGSPRWYLQIQCFCIALLLTIPSLLGSYVVASLVAEYYINALAALNVPSALITSLQNSSIGWIGFGKIIAINLVFIFVLSYTIVRTIINQNPARIFRGQ